eukprot:1593802-Pleurochrysis_carterae.AAC.2
MSLVYAVVIQRAGPRSSCAPWAARRHPINVRHVVDTDGGDRCAADTADQKPRIAPLLAHSKEHVNLPVEGHAGTGTHLLLTGGRSKLIPYEQLLARAELLDQVVVRRDPLVH